MRLESAMFTAREGLQSHGQAISVVGDNVANANTIGFKRQRIEFQDLFSEGDGTKASMPGGDAGTGIKTAAVRQIFDTGVIDFTGRQTDVAIAGDGFFVVGETADPSFTRAGNFTVSETGLLVTADGNPVLGYQGTATALGELNTTDIPSGGQASTTLALYGNLDARNQIATPATAPGSFAELVAESSYNIQNAEIYDSLGTNHNVRIAFTKTGTNTWTAQAFMDGGELTGGTAGVPVLLGSTELVFGGDGLMTTAAKAAAKMSITPNFNNGATAGAVTVDVAGFSQFSATDSVSSVTQNGQGVGNISSYEFTKTGDIYALLDSGSRVKVGQLALADSANRDGLVRAGNSTLKAGDEAGDALYNTATSTRKFGEVTGGALERSTVDVANEFIELVTFQRGYQANSQTLTTASKLISDTLALIR